MQRHVRARTHALCLLTLVLALAISCGGNTPTVIEVTSVTIDVGDSLEVITGGTGSLTATVQPNDATDKTVTWTSSDTAVFEIGSDGSYTAHKAWQVTVTATAGGKTDSVTITVKDPVKAESVSLDKETLDLTVGETAKLTATMTPEDAIDILEWDSTGSSIASVSQDGTVTAVAEGTAKITVRTENGATDSCTVTVSPAPVPVTGLSISNTELQLKKGATFQLSASVQPADATFEGTIVWTSSDDTLASVSESGLVTAISEGPVTITASITVEEQVFTDECKVTVLGDAASIVESITIDGEDKLSLEIGGTQQLTYSVSPEDAVTTVTWSSSNEAVATVTNDTVNAVGVGNAIITVTAVNGGKSDRVTVTVTPIEVTRITLSETAVEVFIGASVELTATIEPEDATDKRISWSSSDNSIASVDDGRVTTRGIGTATITARSVSNEEINASCTIKVKEVPVESIELDRNKLELVIDENTRLTATVLPANATDKTVTWTSSDDGIASVEDGIVTALAGGEACITATAGDKTATCTVTVSDGMTDLGTDGINVPSWLADRTFSGDMEDFFGDGKDATLVVDIWQDDFQLWISPLEGTYIDAMGVLIGGSNYMILNQRGSDSAYTVTLKIEVEIKIDMIKTSSGIDLTVTKDGSPVKYSMVDDSDLVLPITFAQMRFKAEDERDTESVVLPSWLNATYRGEAHGFEMYFKVNDSGNNILESHRIGNAYSEPSPIIATSSDITVQYSSDNHYYLSISSSEDEGGSYAIGISLVDDGILITQHNTDIGYTSYMPVYCTLVPDSEFPTVPEVFDPSTLDDLGTGQLDVPEWLSGKAFLYDMSDQYDAEIITYMMFSEHGMTQRYILGEYTDDDPSPDSTYENLDEQRGGDGVWYIRYSEGGEETEQYWMSNGDGAVLRTSGMVIYLELVDSSTLPERSFDSASVEAIIYKLQDIQSDLADGHTTNPPEGVTWSNTSGSAWTVEFTNFKIEVYADETETRTTTINGTCVLDISAEPRSRAGILSVDLTVDNKDGSGIGLSSEDPSTCEYKYDDRRLVWPN